MKLLITAVLSAILVIGTHSGAAFSQEEKAAYSLVTNGVVDHTDFDLILKGIVFEGLGDGSGASSSTPPTGTRIPKSAKGPDAVEVNSIPYYLIKTDYEIFVRALNAYLNNMSQIETEQLSSEEQLAFWLNVRNALVISAILEHYQTASSHLESLLFGKGAEWNRESFYNQGKKWSIREIEESLVVVKWKDPAVLYGFFYGARGGPSIMNEAFTGKKVFEQLEKNARAYLNRPETIATSRKFGIELPIIYVWHSSLFDNDMQKVVDHIKTYTGSKVSKKLEKYSQEKIAFGFDWALNEVPSTLDDPQATLKGFILMNPCSARWC